ncbi:MAG: hypothetical protein ACOCV2_03725 [Persicimonas sp.]
MKTQLTIILLAVTVGFYGCADDDGNNNPSDDAGGVTDGGGDGGGFDAGDGGEDADGPDSGELDGGGDDADQPDGGEGDAGLDADDDVGEDTGPEGCQPGDTQDSDGDGLYDCEEEQLCTDPHKADTDEDGLSDRQEFNARTDPCDPDSDGDGVEDGKEVELGLDPNKTETFDDGVEDGERWIVYACENPQSEPLVYSDNLEANWTLALPSTFDNNRVDLELPDADTTNRWAGTVYENPTVEVSGFLFSDVPDSSSTPSDLMDHYEGILESEVDDFERTTFNPREFVTHDYQKAQSLEFLVTTDSQMTPNQVREELLFAMAPFDESDVDNNLPTAGGSDYDSFRIALTVTRREYNQDHGGGVQSLVSMAVAPAEKVEENAEIGYRMDDLTNTTNVATNSASDQARCDVFLPEKQSMADFYWVLDQSGSMTSDYGVVRNVAAEFFQELSNTAIDYRLGVTTMDEEHNGRLLGTDGPGIENRPNSWDDRISNPGWHSTQADFDEHVKWVEDCSGADSSISSQCDGGQEWGLLTAQEGIEYMKGSDGSNPGADERIRDDAALITIWMSDEEAQTFTTSGIDSATAQQKLNNFADFFERHTTAFAIVHEGTTCGYQQSEAYPIIAEETGGTAALLCATDDQGNPAHGETIEKIIAEATRETAQDLPETPISSSLRVVVAEQWVPRNDTNGFQYFSDGNAVAFFGQYRPDIPEEGSNDPVDHISITYETFGQGEKQFVDQSND